MKTLFKKAPSILLLIYVFVVSIAMLLITTKGNVTDGKIRYQQYDRSTSVGSPFEASNTTARYALTQAIVDNNSFFLTLDQARFASPDVVDYKGKFLSIFTPGVSFIGVPFYYIGKMYGIPQIATFFSTNLFALLNVFLIARLAQKLGARTITAYIGGLTFLLGSNAIVYAHTFTQHHIATALLLTAVLNATKPRTALRNFNIGMLFGIGALVDIPNVFMMLPVAFYALSQHFSVVQLRTKVALRVKPVMVAMAVGLIPFFALFGYYNIKTAGSPTLLAQSIGRSDILTSETRARTNINEVEGAVEETKSGISLPFNTRRQIRSSYVLLFSDERSWLYYSPVVLVGALGLILGLRARKKDTVWAVVFAIIFMNVTLYTLFGDPWGGWGFGPRYLIPSAAFLCVGIGYVLSIRSKAQLIMTPVFALLLIYSVWVNTLGVITTSMIPPKVEAVSLPVPIPHTYEYNQTFVAQNTGSSLLYNMNTFSVTTLQEFHTLLYYLSISAFAPLMIASLVTTWRKKS